MEKKLSYLWLIPITLLFPMIQNIIFFIRFAKLPFDLFMSSLVFAPTGFISGGVLIYFLRKNLEYTHKMKIVFGYIAGMPFALLFSIFSGLLMHPALVVTVVGPTPLVVGAFLGYSIGKKK
ncbi:hypothetical protein [Anaeromicrobium sediminis]|uniref:Uncharacterized protein n=1 Tax=Anaeromicrobium sediminis TaxID=1478221 RepID=A0A267MGJ9_9FIRM|nr:hypothetical protein [Anaeromicrobium sediminis]PAB58714.1 hypothetical protein CCE28_13670 [Anaeromicrobium sediminis]